MLSWSIFQKSRLSLCVKSKVLTMASHSLHNLVPTPVDSPLITLHSPHMAPDTLAPLLSPTNANFPQPYNQLTPSSAPLMLHFLLGLSQTTIFKMAISSFPETLPFLFLALFFYSIYHLSKDCTFYLFFLDIVNFPPPECVSWEPGFYVLSIVVVSGMCSVWQLVSANRFLLN